LTAKKVENAKNEAAQSQPKTRRFTRRREQPPVVRKKQDRVSRNRKSDYVDLLLDVAAALAIVCQTNEKGQSIVSTIYSLCSRSQANSAGTAASTGSHTTDAMDSVRFSVRCKDGSLSQIQLKAALQAALCSYLDHFGWDATRQVLRSALPRFLSLDVDPTDRTVRKSDIDAVAYFAGKDKAWQLFFAVYSCGTSGCQKSAIFEAVYPGEYIENNLDQQKATVNSLLKPLRVVIDVDRGRWFLRSCGPLVKPTDASKPVPDSTISRRKRRRI
jgi:hypothetical protein